MVVTDCGKLSWLSKWRLFALLATLWVISPQVFAASSAVLNGQRLYNGTTAITGGGSGACINCHFTGPPPNTTQSPASNPPNNHPLAANHPAQITGAIAAGFMSFPGITTSELFYLSMYIGQYKAPAAIATRNVATRANVPVSLEVYQFLPATGLSGVAADNGLTASNTGGAASGSTSATINDIGGPSVTYDIQYTPALDVAGTDTINYKITNPAASNPAANQINVTVYGITNPSMSATAFKGVNNANVFTATTNGGGTFSSSNLAAQTGLAMSAGGVISGTPTATGNFNINVTVTTPLVGGSVTRTLALAIAGITSPATLNLSQNAGTNLPYTITAFPSAQAPFSVLGSLPAGLSLVGNQITGVPTVSGPFQVTLQAGTPLGPVSQVLDISVGPVPLITSTPSVPAAPAIYPTGVTGTAIVGIQIIGSNGPITAYSAVGIAAATGLSVNASGLISGTPTLSGDFPVTLGATNVNGTGTQNVILRINSNVAPNITSAASAAPVNVGSNGTVYTVTANNGPITAYAVVGPSTLPTGLSINATTGVISGTPTASGAFTTTLSATNSGGLTGTKVVSFAINPTTVPVITSPTFASLAVGAAMAPLQVVATNPPILSYAVQAGSTLPVGLSLNTTTGVITGTPTAPGPITTILTATNAAGLGTGLSVPFSIGLPAPSACAMTVPLNTPTTLDLKSCMFPAFSPTGVSVLATPGHGSVTVSGTQATFAPANNYFGSDSFTAVGYFAGGGVTTAGVVTVTVTGRPDPTQDATVTALLNAQADTAQRFARAQISNFQRRMESLHRRDDAGSGAAPSLQFNAPAATPGLAAPRSLAAVAEDARDRIAPPSTPTALSKQQAMDAVASGSGLKSLPFAESVASLLSTNSLNLANLVPSAIAPAQDATSFWAEGVISFGTRDASGASGPVEFSSNGISFGADRRLSDQLVMGLGVGYGRDKTNIGTDGSRNEGVGVSVAVYGSYQPKPGTFIDGTLGVGNLSFDTRRFVAPVNDFALGSRKGVQWFGSVSAGYEFSNNGTLFSPYGRLDYSSDQLQDSTETGAGAYALTYFGQTNSSLQGTLGARAESIHLTSFGWAIPRVRAEYRHEFQSDRLAFMSYADQIGGPRYALATSGSGRDALVLGIGTDFVLRDGWTFGLDYQLIHSFSQDSSYALKMKLTKDIDAKGLPKLTAGYNDNPSKPIDVQVDGSYVYDDNITRAKAGPDQRADSAYVVNVSKSEVISLTEKSRVLLTGIVGGERFQNFNGLSRISAGVEGEFQYRGSSEFVEPTFGLFGKINVERYESYLRNGYRTSLGVSMRQPLTDRISLFGALSHNERVGNSAVFNTTDNAVRLNADYALSDRSTIYATGEFRSGDIVSTGQASLENLSIAKVFVQDDAYPGGQFFSYKFDGRTVLSTLGYNYAFGPRDSLDISWRRVASTPGLRPGFVTSPESYIANQWSITYLVRF